jgi:peroxiredoxin
MAQLRHDHTKFKVLNAEILVVVPNGPKMIGKHVSGNSTPYPILGDPGSKVAEQYGIALRRAMSYAVFTPSVFLVDTRGKIRYIHYSASYVEEPDNRKPLAVLAKLAG